MNGGSVDRILLTGRPSISDGTRNITADNITITTNPKHFDAVGHVKTQFKTTTGQGGVPATSSVSPGGKKPAAKSSAGKGKTTNSSIPEAPQFPVADDVNEY
jgi:hypothetical protein